MPEQETSAAPLDTLDRAFKVQGQRYGIVCANEGIVWVHAGPRSTFMKFVKDGVGYSRSWNRMLPTDRLAPEARKFAKEMVSDEVKARGKRWIWIPKVGVNR